MGLVLEVRLNESVVVTTPSGDNLTIYLKEVGGRRARLLFESDRQKFNVVLGDRYDRERTMKMFKEDTSND